MFSVEPRCMYRHNQLGEVICQLRFPEILSVQASIPAQFQEVIRDEYPVYSVRKELPAPKFSGTLGNLQLQKQAEVNNYQFASADGIWRVNLTSRFISLACSRYSCWEDFAKRLDKPLAAFIQIYRPAFYERVGLRYLNFISRQALSLENEPFRALIEAKYLGLLADEQFNEMAATRSTVDAEVPIRGGCRAKIHAGPGMVKRNGQQESEVKFVLDLDLYMPGKVEIVHSAAALQTLHSQAFPIFRDAITDTLHDAMVPLHKF